LLSEEQLESRAHPLRRESMNFISPDFALPPTSEYWALVD